ncbi:FecR domain-containing protein [Prevotella sp. E2-28]|uniref:FecR domain-containing protein n=1 Tax=Prevotella sp. E2-28 TaxID=2913620 RepID=UPI001EDA0781|nr:FecR domain-containing protein [Prevotella sp. E2-28]UKK53147.1 hypothetical protein L6465_11220 [Prevotella sp. E2-28]
MKTNHNIPTDEQLWNEVLDVLHDNRRELTDEEIEKLTSEPKPSRRWMRIAATFFAVALLSGLAYAAYHFLSPQSTEPSTETTIAESKTDDASSTDDALMRFADVRLDSILSVVGSHYSHQVCFREETLRNLRFTIAWDSVQPLSTFLNNVNEFEGLHLSDERDTIFVHAEKEVKP